MNAVPKILRRLKASERGVAAIEFCLTLPVLLALTFGAYDVSRMVAKRIDYQQALTEAAGLAIAFPPQGSVDYLVNAAAAAASVPATSVVVTRRVECNGTLVTTATCGDPTQEQAIYVSFRISATYVPSFSHFSVDASVPMTVTRTVRVG